jgi:hypothetical protein
MKARTGNSEMILGRPTRENFERRGNDCAKVPHQEDAGVAGVAALGV